MKKSKIIDDDGVAIREDAPVTKIETDEDYGKVEIDAEGFLENGLHWPTIEVLRHSMGSLVTQTSESANDIKEELVEAQRHGDPTHDLELQAASLYAATSMAAKIKKFMDTHLLHAARESIGDLMTQMFTRRVEGRGIIADISVSNRSIEDEIKDQREAIDRARGKSEATIGWTRKKLLN